MWIGEERGSEWVGVEEDGKEGRKEVKEERGEEREEPEGVVVVVE